MQKLAILLCYSYKISKIEFSICRKNWNYESIDAYPSRFLLLSESFIGNCFNDVLLTVNPIGRFSIFIILLSKILLSRITLSISLLPFVSPKGIIKISIYFYFLSSKKLVLLKFLIEAELLTLCILWIWRSKWGFTVFRNGLWGILPALDWGFESFLDNILVLIYFISVIMVW